VVAHVVVLSDDEKRKIIYVGGVVVIKVKEIETKQAEVEAAVAMNASLQAQMFSVIDAASCQQAVDLRYEYNLKAKKWEEARLTITRPLLEAKQAADSLFGQPVKAYKQASDYLSRAILAYQKAEQQKRKAAAEKLRLDEEARVRKEQGKLLARADKAKDEEKAQQLREKAEAIIPVPVTVAPVVVPQGVTVVSRWKADVTDKLALVKAIAAGAASLDWVDVNTALLNKYAVATKGTMPVPGVSIYQEQGLATR